MQDKDFDTKADAQATMDESATPSVLGTDADGTPFVAIVDDHHTLSALDASGYDSVTVTVDIICDLRSYPVDKFWAYLEATNLTYLAAHPAGEPNALPVPIPASDMPTYFSFTSRDQSMSDDPWRSLAGFSRKVRSAPAPAPACDGSGDYKYCERCVCSYVRVRRAAARTSCDTTRLILVSIMTTHLLNPFLPHYLAS